MVIPLPRIRQPRRWLFLLYLVSAALVSVQQGILKPSNNFAIFRFASINLFAGRDLYALHPDQHLDYYEYSPTFALLFAPLAQLPFALGFLCWTLLNALLLWYALERLLPQRQATLALALLYIEVLLAIQYGQSNALVAALMVLGFVALERGRQVEAVAHIGLGAAIKLFPLALLPAAVFHPRRARLALLCLGVAAALVALPLVVLPVQELIDQYRLWRAVEANQLPLRGYSLMHFVAIAIPGNWPNWPVQLAGAAVLLVPLALGRRSWADVEFRRLFLCSVLVYVVLFNHQSERPSFVIAYTGIVVWWLSSAPSRVRTAILVFTLLVMVVHDVDIVPRSVKREFLVPWRVKGIPCLVAWLVMQGELLARSVRKTPLLGPVAEDAPAG